tara:strand:+ start:16039 stop:16395 length:357 start_codon:yes stop_codon:yes gene_type:complete
VVGTRSLPIVLLFPVGKRLVPKEEYLLGHSRTLILLEKAEFIRLEDNLFPERLLKRPSKDLNFFVKSFSRCCADAPVAQSPQTRAKNNENLDFLQTSINNKQRYEHFSLLRNTFFGEP